MCFALRRRYCVSHFFNQLLPVVVAGDRGHGRFKIDKMGVSG